MLNYADKILLGVGVLLISKMITSLVASLVLLLPGIWLYVSMVPIILTGYWFITRLPAGLMDRLRYQNRYQLVCTCAVVGMVLGVV